MNDVFAGPPFQRPDGKWQLDYIGGSKDSHVDQNDSRIHQRYRGEHVPSGPNPDATGGTKRGSWSTDLSVQRGGTGGNRQHDAFVRFMGTRLLDEGLRTHFKLQKRHLVLKLEPLVHIRTSSGELAATYSTKPDLAIYEAGIILMINRLIEFDSEC